MAAKRRGVRRFSEGGSDEIDREDRATGITVSEDYPGKRRVAKSAPRADEETVQEPAEDAEDTSAVTGRADRKYAKSMPSAEKKEENAKNLLKEVGLLALGPYGKAATTVKEAAKIAPRTAAKYKRFRQLSEREYNEARRRMAAGDDIAPSKVHKESRFVRPGTAESARAARVTGMKRGGAVSSASKRADGIAQRGKTKGRVL